MLPRRAGNAKFAAFRNFGCNALVPSDAPSQIERAALVFHTQFASVISGRGSLTADGGAAAEPGQQIPLAWFSPPLDLSQSQGRETCEAKAQSKGRATQPLRGGRQPRVSVFRSHDDYGPTVWADVFPMEPCAARPSRGKYIKGAAAVSAARLWCGWRLFQHFHHFL